jgi:hypothetical protein
MAYGKVRVDQIQSTTRTVDVDDLATTDAATQSVPGLLSAADKTKLDGIATGAEVNVNADWNATTGDAAIQNKPTLGTAAAKNVGTASGNVVELDGSARLPAVDGSQLTGINTAGTDLTYTTATRLLASSTGSDVTLPVFASGVAGLVPATSSGGTTNFLRADGTFAAPPGGAPGGSDTQVQFNDGGTAFGGDAGLVFNKTTNKLTAGGDVELNDGGTFTTTLQTVTPTANRTISFPDATGTVALVAGSSGQLVVNQSGVYAGVANSSVDNATGNVTLGSRFISTVNGAAEASPVRISGTWFAGTSANSFPALYVSPTGTSAGTSWSTSGTGIGVNAAAAFGGNLLDLQVNGSSKTAISSSGNVAITGNLTSSATTFTVADTAGGMVIGRTSAAIAFGATQGGNAHLYLDHNIFNIRGGSSLSFSSSSVQPTSLNADLSLFRDAADTLAQRRTTNAQTFRVYNTYTSSTNYELGKLEWSSNVFRIGTEKGSGGGTARTVEVHTDSIARLALDTTGSVRVVTALTVATLPGTPAVGMVARVTDATAPAVGTTVAGGGAAAALCWYNGANWSVIGV